MTTAQRSILRNSLGLLWRDRPYRNRYATAPGCDGYDDVQALVDAGLMERGADITPGQPGYAYFHVTPAGAAAIEADLPED